MKNPLVGARIMISGIGRHLVDALPDHISVPLGEQPYLTAVVMPLIEEVTTPRCGGQAAFQRLCEVVVIRLLRHAMEEGRADSGLLSGLAHPRIAAALVAIHEAPAQAWTLEKLADTAGMSRTQFAVTFKELVGTTPMVYLAHWRLDIARAELETGRQVKSVASLCGFTSPAAFSRAFSRRFGYPPRQRRAQAA
ncbi:AraC family transcriptional regulator [Roseibium salinum]|nr:AraC family transcriptional regulator [Roseibium salinum]